VTSADAGVADARTALAWQRTALSIVAAAAILMRLTLDRLGLVAVVALGVSALVSAWVFTESWWRYGRKRRTRYSARSRRAGVPLALTIAASLLAATELTATLTS